MTKNKPPKKKRWTTLEHNGIVFPPEFQARGITLSVKGEEVRLTPLEEEMAYQWAKKKDTDYVKDRVFQKNFVGDLARELASSHGAKFKRTKYEDIDFGPMYDIVEKEKQQREMMTKEDRKALAAKRKEIREEMRAKYGKAVIDGSEVDIANYMAEPPGIFMGRGKHPLRGRWKRRITPEDVTLNLGKKAPVPPGNWGKIVNNHEATWLANWVDGLTRNTKYIWLADTADLKQQNDREKYEKASKLAKSINKIRKKMISDMEGGDEKTKRIATVCYLIFRTAMRVGDEKSEEEADTVGATTLRKEHIAITDAEIRFDFLGKDSVRWQETIKARGPDATLRDNLSELLKTKKDAEEVFQGIRSPNVNEYFGSIAKGVTAKVFRTYLATTEVRNYLKEHSDLGSKSPNHKIYHARMANLMAAIKCNHKRTIPKSYKKSLEKRREMLKKARAATAKTAKQRQRKRERVERIRLQLDLAAKTRDYNLGTSLRNYIDPRIVKAWTDSMDVQWEKLYTAALQKKFLWVHREKLDWNEM